MQKTEILSKLATRSGTHAIKLLRRDGKLYVAEYKDGHKWNEENVASVNEGLELVESIRQEELEDGIQLIRCHGYQH